MPRTRVILRRNGSKVGEVSYASESEAVAHAAKMQGAASGLEALLAPVAPKSNRWKRSTDVQTLLFPLDRYTVAQAKAWAKAEGFRYGSVDEGGPRATMLRLRQHDPKLYVEGTFRTITLGDAVEAVIGVPKKGAVRGPHSITVHRRGYTTRRGTHVSPTTFTEIGGYDSRGPRRNPTPIDIGSLDFGHFKKTVKIDSYYNVRTGRRFARVVSKDGTFVTDVPVADGGRDGSRAKGADAIKRRAYEQLRIHLQPSAWKPSVRVNPAGSVAYGGTTIRIAAGTYTVMPHGPAFSGPNGFVAAKKWIDSHGA